MRVEQGGEDGCLQGIEREGQSQRINGGGGAGQGTSPGKVPVGGRATLLCQVPFTQPVPLSPQQGVCQGPPTTTRLAALSPGPAGLTQWTLSQKLKLLQNRNPSPCTALHPNAHLNSPVSPKRMGRGSPLPEMMHIQKLLSAQQAHLDPWENINKASLS